MYNAIHLTLMIGPVVPIPVPQVVLDALTNVEIKTTAGKASGFQLSFTLSNNSPLHTLFLLSGGASIPFVRVVIVVTINGMPEVLMDGVMTNHEISSGKDPGHSVLTVTGEDLTRVMDYIDFSGIPYIGMPREARVALILAKYMIFGIVPMVIPSVFMDVPIPTERIPRHQGTDVGYIKYLANQVGHVFYIEPGPVPLMNIAYWGPEIKVGVPQPALNVNMDTFTNVEKLSFSFKNSCKTIPIVYIQNSTTKLPIPIPVPDITPLNPPLGLIPPLFINIKNMEGTSMLSPIQAAMAGMVEAAKSSEAVTANGSLDVLRYGHILKARRLVGVRGAGQAFDGLYYVKSVTHSIKRGEYKQSFVLSRNGLISTFRRVPV